MSGTDGLPIPDAEPRITASEICIIGKFSRATLGRRVHAGRFPAPIDKGREQLFDRRAVYEALGISQKDDNHAQDNPWERGALALHDRKTAAIRHHPASR